MKPFGGLKLTLCCLCAIFSVGAQSRHAQASELFIHPIFTSERIFKVEAPLPTEDVSDASMPIKAVIFDKAVQSCHLSIDEIRGSLSQVLDQKSALWNTLDLIFSRSLEQVQSRNLTVVIDDFSSFAGSQPEFASYYVHADRPIIGLDCSALARSYWLPSLAHEMTHALLDGKDVYSGWEEGLAQLMEAQVGGAQPSLTLKHLESATEVPSPLEWRRPLPSHESYAVTYLFAQYIRQEFGGWSVLQAMSGLNDDPSAKPCQDQSDLFSRMVCRGHAFLQNGSRELSTALRDGLSAEKMTPRGLLRYFYVALTMNNPTYPHYRISGWSGLNPLPKSLTSKVLESGQAAVFSQAPPQTPSSQDIELYHIAVSADGDFQIVQGSGKVPPFHSDRDYFLLINLGINPQQITPDRP